MNEKVLFIIAALLVIIFFYVLFGKAEADTSNIEIDLSVYVPYNDIQLDEVHIRADIIYNFTDTIYYIPYSHLSQYKEDDEFVFDGTGIGYRFKYGKLLSPCR